MSRDSIEISSSELLKQNSINLNWSVREFSNNNFWHYTSVPSAKKILKNNTLRLSKISDMNDLNEKKAHKEESDNVYCISFSNTKTENLPMWYLYGGIDGKGIAIGFKPTLMFKLIKQYLEKDIKYVYAYKKKNSKEGERLEIGKDVEIEFGWVFYKTQRNELFFKDNKYSVKDDIDTFLKNNYFYKDYGWNYEKEFRIVINNKTKTNYSKMEIIFPEMKNAISIKGAPTFGKEFKDYLIDEGIKSKNLKNVSLSAYDVEMDLFNRNIIAFVEHIKELKKKKKLSKDQKDALKSLSELFVEEKKCQY